jgi:hypothetical protein
MDSWRGCMAGELHGGARLRRVARERGCRTWRMGLVQHGKQIRDRRQCSKLPGLSDQAFA